MPQNQTLPETQCAVQLTGPSKLELNPEKPVIPPGPTQVLMQVEAVGLCFSDLKLLKQFDGHARKSDIIAGITPEVLAEIPSYHPNQEPTVPGHEAVGRIVAVGEHVTRHRVGERVLVQTDYRALRTARSNAAFGYNLEGGLQEFALLDERVIICPDTDERFLIPVDDSRSASSIALVEPWACVEDSYVTEERRTVLAGGKLLVVAEAGHRLTGITDCFGDTPPAAITAVVADADQAEAAKALGADTTIGLDAIADLPKEFDDIIYFGAVAATVEALNDKQANGAILNIVTAGKPFGTPVSLDVGRVHYGMIRFTGTTNADASVAYRHIPATGELRDNERLLVVGAGGPMGQMHVLRAVSLGFANTTVVATDFDDQRLASLQAKAAPTAVANHVTLQMVNPKTQPVQGPFTYSALMAPVPRLVAQAVADSTDHTIINIFAGIPAGTRVDIDIDTYLANRCWMFGTSGSVIRDMKIVLERVTNGQLDTDASVDAVCGMAGAIEGIAAVENRTLAGKIVVYPRLHDMGLVPLDEIEALYPTVAEKLDNGLWNKEAEAELLAVAE